MHLLNVLALPFVTMIYYYKRFEFYFQDIYAMTAISIAMIVICLSRVSLKYLPHAAEFGGAFGLAVVIVAILIAVVWSINNNKKLASIASLSIFLIIVGYSTYTMIFIRSNLDPIIDENNPETIEKFISYLNREQYGDHSITDRAKVWRESPNGKNYKSAGEYFWKYQIDHMYIRYFLWQYVGMDENERDWSVNQFYAIPFYWGCLVWPGNLKMTINMLWPFWPSFS